MSRRPFALLACLPLLAPSACFWHHAKRAAPAAVTPRERSIDSLWTRGTKAYDRGDWNRAQQTFDLIGPVMQPTDPRYYRLHFYQGELLFLKGNQLQAVREFRRVADERPDGPLAPDALVRAGDAYADLWRGPELDPTYGETAKSVYEEVGTRYPGTPAAGRAALRLAVLGEKFALKEYKNALFYFKFKAYDSAILLFRAVIATYPRSSVVPDALERLVRSYQILGYKEDVKETCAYIAQYAPDPAGPARLCPKSESGQGKVASGKTPHSH